MCSTVLSKPVKTIEDLGFTSNFVAVLSSFSYAPQEDKLRACVKIYVSLSLFEEAVDLALKVLLCL
jgi:hypothetical protein